MNSTNTTSGALSPTTTSTFTTISSTTAISFNSTSTSAVGSTSSPTRTTHGLMSNTTTLATTTSTEISRRVSTTNVMSSDTTTHSTSSTSSRSSSSSSSSPSRTSRFTTSTTTSTTTSHSPTSVSSRESVISSSGTETSTSSSPSATSAPQSSSGIPTSGNSGSSNTDSSTRSSSSSSSAPSSTITSFSKVSNVISTPHSTQESSYTTTTVSNGILVTVTELVPLPSGAANPRSNSFLHRKGAAAGVFTLIGIAAGAVLLTFLVRFYRRRNRKRRERLHESFFSPGEKDLYGAAGATAAGVRPLGAGSGGSSGHDGAALTARSGGVRMDSDVTNHSSLNGDLSSNSAHHLLSVTPAVNSRRFSDPYVQQQQQQQAQTQAGGLLAPPNTNGVARWSLSEFDDYYNPNADTHAAEGIYLSGSGENGIQNQTGPAPHAAPFELYQPPISDPFNPPDAPSDPSPLLALPDAAADALRRTSPSPVHSTKDLVAMGFGRRRSKPPQEPQGYAPPPSAYIPRDTSRSSGAVSPSFAMTPMGSSSAGNHSQQQTRHQYPPPQPPPPARRRAGSGVTVESSAGGPRSSSSQAYSYSVYSETERSSYSHSRTQSHGRRESHSHNGSIDTRARSSHSHSHSHSRSYDESEDEDVSVEDDDLDYSGIFGDSHAVDGEELDRHRDALEPALAPVRSAQDGGSIGRVSPEMMRAASGNKDANGSTNGGHTHIWGLDRDDASSAVVSLSDAVDYSRRVVSSSALGPGVVNSRA